MERLDGKRIVITGGTSGMGEGVVWGTTMAMWKILLIVANIALVALSAVWGLVAFSKAKTKVKDKEKPKK